MRAIHDNPACKHLPLIKLNKKFFLGKRKKRKKKNFKAAAKTKRNLFSLSIIGSFYYLSI